LLPTPEPIPPICRLPPPFRKSRCEPYICPSTGATKPANNTMTGPHRPQSEHRDPDDPEMRIISIPCEDRDANLLFISFGISEDLLILIYVRQPSKITINTPKKHPGQTQVSTKQYFMYFFKYSEPRQQKSFETLHLAKYLLSLGLRKLIKTCEFPKNNSPNYPPCFYTFMTGKRFIQTSPNQLSKTISPTYQLKLAKGM